MDALADIIGLADASAEPFIFLDLADEAQYRFVLYRLRQAGKNEQNAPHLFARLEMLRQKHLRGERNTPPTLLEDNLHSFDHLVSGSVAQNNLVHSYASATVRFGTTYSLLDAQVADTFGSPLGNLYCVEEFDDGHWLDIEAVGALPPDLPMDMFRTNSLYLAEVDGFDPVLSFISKKLFAVRGVSILQPFDSLEDDAPIVDGVIVNQVCLMRQNDDCDYSVQGHGREIVIPLKGAMILSIPAIYTPTIPEVPFNLEETFILLTDEAYGGTVHMQEFANLEDYLHIVDICPPPPPPTSTMPLLSANAKEEAYHSAANTQDCPVDPESYRLFKVAWNIPAANFGHVLFGNRKQVDWIINLSVNLRLTLFNGDSILINREVALSNQNLPPDLPGSAYGAIRPLSFRYSCIAAGSQILMSDGTLKAIEEVQSGEKVQANGAVLTVASTSIGIEEIPMIRILDQTGASVLLTYSHPVLTQNRGIIWAEEVQAGDVVLKMDGPAEVKSVTREMFDGHVYNLKLGAPSELPEMGPDSNAFYANGFLVGDLTMQNDYSFKDLENENKGPMLARLPAEWHADYLNRLHKPTAAQHARANIAD